MAFPQEAFRNFESAQNCAALPANEFLKLCLRAGNFEPCERQVGAEGAILRREAQRRHGAFNAGRKLRERGRSVEPGPEDSRPARIREKPKTPDYHRERLKGFYLSQRPCDFCHLLIRDFTQKLQGQVDPFRARPACIRGHGSKTGLLLGKSLAKFFRQLDGDKGSHKVSRLSGSSGAEAFRERTERKAGEHVRGRRGSGTPGLQCRVRRRAR